jgi:isoleucyl-tRNA synthetase
MAGYRDTLNLPKTEFPMKADLPRREPDRLRSWTERDLYAKRRDARRGRPVWLLHDGPPYSNGHLHMGTAANKIWKDAAVRAHAMLGFDAPYTPGWDNHGMPIEVQVAKDMKTSGSPPDRVALRKRCREYATKWVGIQREEFERLGVWGEWEHPYLTMDHGFEAAILEAFAGLAERGFIQRGLRSIHWCPTDRTALAEAEIEYQDDPSPSIYVPFPLRRDAKGALAKFADVAAVAWTTTPWTLPANLGLMVDPGAAYAVLAADGHRFLIAEARLESVQKAVGWKDPRIEARIQGADLVGAIFEGPWGNDSRVVDGTPYVSLEDGTGLVHTAPGHGKEDFAVGERSGLGVLCPVDEAGRFLAGAEPFVGRSVLEVNDDIIAWLADQGRLLAKGTLVHAYPHCWRCRRPVIFRATNQWFMIIDRHGHRDRVLEVIDEAVQWEPPSSKNRIREAVRTRPDWCLSRQRAWGVGIPAIYCETCDHAMLDANVMQRAADLTRELGSDAWFELPVDRYLPENFACHECRATGPFRKETDILDVWFDSGSTHRAVQATHPDFKRSWDAARAQGGRIAYFEGPDQHRGWFNSSLMVSVGLDRKAPYTDVLTHGWVLDAEGKAMHKSLGNVISPLDVVQRLGADVVRWWALATDWRNDVRVGDEILQRVADAYRKVRNTFRFLLGNLDGFDPKRDLLPPERLTRVDRAILASMRATLASVQRDWRDLEFHRALDGVSMLCTVDLSAVFLDVAKDRLYTLAPDDPARRSAQTVLWHALHDLLLATSPALVFTTDEAWQHHPALVAESESVHLAEWTTVEATESGRGDWAFLLEVRAAVNAAIEPLRASKALATTTEAEVEITLAPDAAAALRDYQDELPGFLMVAAARIVESPGASEIQTSVAKTTFAKCERCWTYRADVADSGLCARCSAVLDATGRRIET